ncbi:MAG: hypothetical protein WC380_06050 [Pedobacter sp.]|jgi:hypothetical protein
MDSRSILRKLEEIEKNQGKILYYIRTIAEQNGTSESCLPEVIYNDQEVMFILSWSKSTLKRRRIAKEIRFFKHKNKYYYLEKDVYAVLFQGLGDGEVN